MPPPEPRESHGRNVSIRARHCWRAMRVIPNSRRTTESGFNPRPPWLAGDAQQIAHHPGRLTVSIRARHCWRAMPPQQQQPQGNSEFQSAPAIAGGRCCGPRIHSQRLGCFNPRPPLLAGDAFVVQCHGRQGRVSIRARHCWRAMPPSRRPCRARHRFQSAPAIAGGRCPPTASRATPSRAPFQSAPAIAGGRCRAARAQDQHRRCFNPRPPLLAGDAPLPPGTVTVKQFQSAPAIAGGRCGA